MRTTHHQQQHQHQHHRTRLWVEREPNVFFTETVDPDRVIASYSSDLAKWSKTDDIMREYFASNKPCQNIGDFSASLKQYGGTNRSLIKEHFFRKN